MRGFVCLALVACALTGMSMADRLFSAAGPVCQPCIKANSVFSAAQNGSAADVLNALALELGVPAGTPNVTLNLTAADDLHFANVVRFALYPYETTFDSTCGYPPKQPLLLNVNQTAAIGGAFGMLLASPELELQNITQLAAKIVRSLAWVMETCAGPQLTAPGSESFPFESRLLTDCCYAVSPVVVATSAYLESVNASQALEELAGALTQLYDAQSSGSMVFDVSYCALQPCDGVVSGICCDVAYNEDMCNGDLERFQGSARVLSMQTGLYVEEPTVRLWGGENSTIPGSTAGTCRCPKILSLRGGYLGTRLAVPFKRRLMAGPAAQLSFETEDAGPTTQLFLETETDNAGPAALLTAEPAGQFSLETGGAGVGLGQQQQQQRRQEEEGLLQGMDAGGGGEVGAAAAATH